MTDLQLALLIALAFGLLVCGGTVYYFKRTKKPIIWKIVGWFTGAAVVGVMLIYLVTEYLAEL